MPISCHFRECKALLLASLTRVSGAITSVIPTIYAHRLRLSGVLLFCTSSLELSRDIHKTGEHFQ